MDFAALIKQARHDAHVTQEELARRVGRSRMSISQLEAGTTDRHAARVLRLLREQAQDARG